MHRWQQEWVLLGSFWLHETDVSTFLITNHPIHVQVEAINTPQRLLLQKNKVPDVLLGSPDPVKSPVIFLYQFLRIIPSSVLESLVSDLAGVAEASRLRFREEKLIELRVGLERLDEGSHVVCGVKSWICGGGLEIQSKVGFARPFGLARVCTIEVDVSRRLQK